MTTLETASKKIYTITLVGGTGNQGPGLALRWAIAGHQILIGSRVFEKAQATAARLTETLANHNIKANYEYGVNADVVGKAEVVVLTIPYEAVRDTLKVIKNYIKPKTIVVSPVVPMATKEEGLVPTLVPEGSAAELVAKELTDAIVVGALQNVSAEALDAIPDPLDGDVVVCGEDKEAKNIVMQLVSDIPNLKPTDGGKLKNCRMIEPLTVLLVILGKKLKNPRLSVKFV
jgi:NADPH-dependent F420 reductase